ncbi:Cyclin N-terminal domain-containing protein [Mycena venus]|uniref:Cyclin N-terminal domain-containing protein n=1 Tax=Mycena venus TaxID=2733690 RepID=A0A8H7CM81_9AGAR|nr:Cyclin N-terminal domain-containing protein [Mycena venus]
MPTESANTQFQAFKDIKFSTFYAGHELRNSYRIPLLYVELNVFVDGNEETPDNPHDEESPIETSSEDNGAVQSQYSDKGSLPGPIQNEADNSSISDEERITETQMDGGNRAAQTQDSDKAGPSLNKADNSSTSDEESPTDTRLDDAVVMQSITGKQYSSMHPASLVDPATHAPALMQLLDIKLDRHVIDYVVDCVSETVDYAMGRSSSLTFRTQSPLPPQIRLLHQHRPLPCQSHPRHPPCLSRLHPPRPAPTSPSPSRSGPSSASFSAPSSSHPSLFGKRDVGRMEREFLDVLDWELGVQEADLLAHHEGLVGAQERAFIASRAPLLTTRVKTPTKDDDRADTQPQDERPRARAVLPAVEPREHGRRPCSCTAQAQQWEQVP